MTRERWTRALQLLGYRSYEIEDILLSIRPAEYDDETEYDYV